MVVKVVTTLLYKLFSEVVVIVVLEYREEVEVLPACPIKSSYSVILHLWGEMME